MRHVNARARKSAFSPAMKGLGRVYAVYDVNHLANGGSHMRYSPWPSMVLWAGFLLGSRQMLATPLACPDNNFLNAYIDLGVTGCTS
jgi:hypothetical protein